MRTETVLEALRAAKLLQFTRGQLPELVTALTDDSRVVTPGSLFVAVRGSAHDGHGFLGEAESRGATVALVEDPARTSLPAIVVSDARAAAAHAASAAYGRPADALRMIAVTGTNGKTTTVSLIRHLLDEPDSRCASVGTVGVLVGSEGEPLAGGGGLTTPGPIELQRLLAELLRIGVRTVAMEVSSHSLDQRRVDGVSFEAAVFTNLTRDHLDYHGTMESYAAAKARLLGYLQPRGVTVINADDPAWERLPRAGRVVTFGTAGGADVSASRIDFASSGARFDLAAPSGAARVSLPLLGQVNVSNALAAAAASLGIGTPFALVAERLETMPQVPGRLEIIARAPTVVRDYAHTPDALERSLAAIRPFTTGRLILVFGCGGDRDRGKRPLMGQIAEQGADVVIITSDNPRNENPDAILDDIESGMTTSRHSRVEDRRAAIALALQLASTDDLVLLAGKGHETYQIRGSDRLPFDEREIVRSLLDPAS